MSAASVQDMSIVELNTAGNPPLMDRVGCEQSRHYSQWNAGREVVAASRVDGPKPEAHLLDKTRKQSRALLMA
jgi:hypothetical protein